MCEEEKPTTVETLQMVRACVTITEPIRRQEVLALAQRYASESPMPPWEPTAPK